MNRFDRVTSLLLLLQTRSVITAQFLSDHFGVSERTIYRDIRTLETAGVPIGSEAGVGYFLLPGYRLPPISFTLDEASSLLLGEKLLVASLDKESLGDYKQALNKVRAVIDNEDKDFLSAFDADIEVQPTGSHFPLEVIEGTDGDSAGRNRLADVPQQGHRWLRECRDALLRRQVVEIDYAAQSTQEGSTRAIEPIGLFYYHWHWHLIAWCRLRESYRDFRLDRISRFSPLSEQFPRHSRLTLQEYMSNRPGQEALLEVELLFKPEAARFVEEQRYLFGFIDEEVTPEGVLMRFLTPVPDYLARWLLQYTSGVELIRGDAVREALQRFSTELARHWSPPPQPS